MEISSFSHNWPMFMLWFYFLFCLPIILFIFKKLFLIFNLEVIYPAGNWAFFGKWILHCFINILKLEICRPFNHHCHLEVYIKNGIFAKAWQSQSIHKWKDDASSYFPQWCKVLFRGFFSCPPGNFDDELYYVSFLQSQSTRHFTLFSDESL